MSCTNCPDAPLIPPSVTLPDCPGGSPCEEVSMGECVRYVGPHLPTLGVLSGTSIKEVLVALNKKLTQSFVTKTYTITVLNTQTTTTVEYINNLGNLVSKTVAASQSPVTICAQEGSPVKIKGTGTFAVTGTCSITTT